MSSGVGQLVLAISDAGLRSMLAALIGMAGEIPISTASHLHPTLGGELRATALLIIEDALIASPSHDWADVLRAQCWFGRIIVVVDELPAHPPRDETMAFVEKRRADAAILPLLRLWQSQAGAQLTLPE